MWYMWTTLLLVSCTLVKADVEAGTEEPAPVATTRAPPRTLDRKAAELVWKTWLESPEGNNQNAPPRRITTKSLFITPLVCPKGQRLDRNACIQVVTVNKDEHERILLETLNALFTTPPSDGQINTDVLYDYGEDEPGPLQLSIPIGLDPQAAPLQGQEPYAQAQDLHPNYVNIDKKDGTKSNGDDIKAELELLSLQNALNQTDKTDTNFMNQNILTNIHNHPEKPKRDSPMLNMTEIESLNITELGQKELIYGHVNVDPVLYNAENNEEIGTHILEDTETSTKRTEIHNSAMIINKNDTDKVNSSTVTTYAVTSNKTTEHASNNSSSQLIKKQNEQSKLNPENDYSDIGETIKLISRYADVTTDDNFAKEQNKYGIKDDSILGTRTKAQYRRNKPKGQQQSLAAKYVSLDVGSNDKIPLQHLYQTGHYYRYPWSVQNSPTPPPDYPFRHLQDYWPGRSQIGGLYNTHENPRRHHHSYPHNFRLQSFPHPGLNVPPNAYPERLKRYIQRIVQHHVNPMRSHSTANQDLYSLLGLRHWFSSEGISKR